ncbi:GNAT family N-acetyltransferase [Metabacillus dongyingensis]|uniref:GNAT family N-acetyltransferase n=1 Tax=Metabacillus dongyingensis TaxID=2874282 RepID=UPI001CBC1D45|nr:GNAT family N-acetyltransferase [Metabacillus dongyingensis]
MAAHSQKIIGFEILTQNREIRFLYTHTDHQRKGTASALLQGLEETAKEADHKSLTFSTGITVIKKRLT